MIDTIKLLLDIPKPNLLDGSRFEPITISQLINAGRSGRSYLKPSPAYAAMGKYMPKLALFKRPAKFGAVYQLSVEFSAPKMLFGNNFEELTEQDFNQLLIALQNALHELIGYRFPTEQLANASVSGWHPSKNIIFTDYTSSQTVLSTLAKLDISRIYDVQKTDFRDGHVLHIHCNSLDIAFYDKMADLRQAKISDKRAIEDNSGVQRKLLDTLDKYLPLEVFRYEVRLNGRQAIKRAYPELTEWTFAGLFNQRLCQQVLQRHWNKMTASVDMLGLDTDRPLELLQNHLVQNRVTPQTALAAVGAMLVVNQAGVTGLRNTLTAHFGKQAWYRIKPLLRPPISHRFSYFLHIDQSLKKFVPVRISDFKRIENNSK